MPNRGAWLAAAILAFAVPAAAQPARPSIGDAAWLTGRWVGEGLGGQVEESWSAAHDGQMLGYFSLVRNGAPVFHELMMLDEQPDGLRLRVKHFNPDFTGWEDKAGWHSFEPDSVAPASLRFRGLWMRREGDELLITVTLKARGAVTATDHLLRLRKAP